MISDDVNKLIQNIGVLTELWTITYSGFVRQGLDPTSAMAHTKGFMEAMVQAFANDTNDRKEEK